MVTDVYQNVQNVAARLLKGHGCRDHGLRQVMRDELHWLRVLRFFGMYPAMGVALYHRGVMDNLAR